MKLPCDSCAFREPLLAAGLEACGGSTGQPCLVIQPRKNKTIETHWNSPCHHRIRYVERDKTSRSTTAEFQLVHPHVGCGDPRSNGKAVRTSLIIKLL